MLFRFINYLLMAVALILTGCQSNVTRVAPRAMNSAQVIKQARAQIGRPYHYGGESPQTGFDCSGLVFYSHQRTGHRVPRTAGQQYRATVPIARKNLRPGDLVFFRFRRSRQVSHVGIYLGANRFVHAPATNKRVSIANLSNPYWSRHFVRGGRFRL